MADDCCLAARPGLPDRRVGRPPPPEVQDRAPGLASATLRRLTGYRVGGCPITVRPCMQVLLDR